MSFYFAAVLSCALHPAGFFCSRRYPVVPRLPFMAKAAASAYKRPASAVNKKPAANQLSKRDQSKNGKKKAARKRRNVRYQAMKKQSYRPRSRGLARVAAQARRAETKADSATDAVQEAIKLASHNKERLDRHELSCAEQNS